MCGRADNSCKGREEKQDSYADSLWQLASQPLQPPPQAHTNHSAVSRMTKYPHIQIGAVGAVANTEAKCKRITQWAHLLFGKSISIIKLSIKEYRRFIEFVPWLLFEG